MKEKTCCFSGHRNIPAEKRETIYQRLKTEIKNLVQNGYTDFLAGGALGFDTLAAEAVLNLKTYFPKIRLVLILPCISQEKYWSDDDKIKYEEIKFLADEVYYTSQTYFNGCMHKRNRYLVDKSSVCICYMTDTKGGTAFTVSYAQKHNLRIINISDLI